MIARSKRASKIRADELPAEQPLELTGIEAAEIQGGYHEIQGGYQGVRRSPGAPGVMLDIPLTTGLGSKSVFGIGGGVDDV